MGPSVRLFRRICCFLLLALWLVSTQHCGLEAAGIEFHPHTEHPSECCTSTCSNDVCDIIERGTFNQVTFSPRPPPPVAVLTSVFPLLVAPPMEVEEPGIAIASATPELEAITGTWRFERRSALPARAPDLLA